MGIDGVIKTNDNSADWYFGCPECKSPVYAGDITWAEVYSVDGDGERDEPLYGEYQCVRCEVNSQELKRYHKGGTDDNG